MSYYTLLSTPLSPGISLSIDDCPVTLQKINEIKLTLYFKALGSLMWLFVAICPDLSFAVNILSHFSHNPKKPYWNTLKHTMVYMKGTIDYGITYRGGANLNPIGYMDSDYASYKDTRRSTEGNIIVIARGPVSWESKHQKTVVLSTVKSKYMAFICTTAQRLWILKFFTEIGLPQHTPIVVHANNSSSIINSTTDKHHC